MIFSQVHKMWLLKVLADCGNFQEACAVAHITQSAYSQNLTSLENYLQKSLIVRERGHITLTREGMTLLETVTPILQDLAKIEMMGTQKDTLQGNIRLGAYESIAVNFLPKLFKLTEISHPGLKFDVRTSRSEKLVQLVSSGSLDVALTVNAPVGSKYSRHTLSTDQLGLYVATSSANYGDPLKRLTSHGLATISPSKDGHPPFYQKFIKRIPVSFNTNVSCDSFETIRSLAETGPLVGLLPNNVAQCSGGSITKIWPTKEEDSLVSSHRIHLVCRKTTHQSYVNFLREQLTPLFR